MLHDLIKSGVAQVDRQRPDDPVNALSLIAALVDRAPQWASDPTVPVLLRQVLSAWAVVSRMGLTGEAMNAMGRGEVDVVLRRLPESDRRLAAGPLQALARLGHPGQRLVESLMGQVGTSEAASEADLGVETECAGAFFLIRAVLDLRLPSLVIESGGDLLLFQLLLAEIVRTLVRHPIRNGPGPLAPRRIRLPAGAR